ncbi:MAG: phage replisome organizer N-terminal domain-containing protein, partial [Sarcina sp.]
MAINKIYYWLKLKNNFFKQKEIKKLRKMAGGDTFTIIYLKLQLLSLTDEAKLYFEGIEDNFVEELALELDEEVENVRMTLLYLQKHNLIVEVEEDEYLLPETLESIGKESASTIRSRRSRTNKALQCNTNATKCNTEIEIEKEIEKEIDNIGQKNSKAIPDNLQQVAEAWNSLNLSEIKSIKNN